MALEFLYRSHISLSSINFYPKLLSISYLIETWFTTFVGFLISLKVSKIEKGRESYPSSYLSIHIYLYIYTYISIYIDTAYIDSFIYTYSIVNWLSSDIDYIILYQSIISFVLIFGIFISLKVILIERLFICGYMYVCMYTYSYAYMYVCMYTYMFEWIVFSYLSWIQIHLIHTELYNTELVN